MRCAPSPHIREHHRSERFQQERRESKKVEPILLLIIVVFDWLGKLSIVSPEFRVPRISNFSNFEFPLRRFTLTPKCEWCKVVRTEHYGSKGSIVQAQWRAAGLPAKRPSGSELLGRSRSRFTATVQGGIAKRAYPATKIGACCRPTESELHHRQTAKLRSFDRTARRRSRRLLGGGQK